ncbi:serine/threonine-protein kinase [Nonomuraea sp. NPDC001023]|uniref:serine/threonine-protein kinase n=1 Tax=unclassified Nonomuraea TaxID=2593643 RepID=UPI003322B3BA
MVIPLTPDDPAFLGDFRLAGRLGEGGQGVVYLAHSASGEPVAVKLLNAGDQETRARLARELDALESIASFCTARVLDVSTRGSRPYVVSEFVDGPSLADRVAGRSAAGTAGGTTGSTAGSTAGRGPLRGGELERLAVGTATALAAIHAAGVVHRDFKPSNVLLGPDGPRVVDFGIARAEGAATHTSGLVGTPAYLSPEQIAGSPASGASDVFAWGATMVYAATGVSPFGADTVPAVLHRVLHAEPDLSALPPRLRGPVAGALAKDPAHRPTAAALLMTLVSPSPATGPGAGPGAVPGSAPGAGRGPGPGPGRGAGPGTGPGPEMGPGAGRGTRSPRLDPGAADTRESRAARNRGRRALVGAGAALLALAVAGGVVLLTTRTPGSTATRSTPPPSTAAALSSPPSAPPSAPPSTATGPATPAATSPAATAPATGGTGDLKIPAAFAGTWSGHTDTTNPLDPDGAENTVELKAGQSRAAWKEKDSQVDCAATITLTEVRPDRLTFSLGTSTGGCIPGTVWLELEGDTLTYTWRDVPGLGMVTQTGNLTKK